MTEINPEHSVGFLVGRIDHLMKIHINTFLSEESIQLSSEKLSILMVLAHLPSAKSMGPLAELLGRDPTTLKRQLDSLVKAALVIREPSPTDRRVVVISITSKGKNLVQQTMPMTLALQERAMSHISESDAQILRKSLSQMLHNLKEGVL